MLVQPGLCRTCSETTLLVFPRGGSYLNFHSTEKAESDKKEEAPPEKSTGRRGRRSVQTETKTGETKTEKVKPGRKSFPAVLESDNGPSVSNDLDKVDDKVPKGRKGRNAKKTKNIDEASEDLVALKDDNSSQEIEKAGETASSVTGKRTSRGNAASIKDSVNDNDKEILERTVSESSAVGSKRQSRSKSRQTETVEKPSESHETKQSRTKASKSDGKTDTTSDDKEIPETSHRTRTKAKSDSQESDVVTTSKRGTRKTANHENDKVDETDKTVENKTDVIDKGKGKQQAKAKTSKGKTVTAESSETVSVSEVTEESVNKPGVRQSRSSKRKGKETESQDSQGTETVTNENKTVNSSQDTQTRTSKRKGRHEETSSQEQESDTKSKDDLKEITNLKNNKHVKETKAGEKGKDKTKKTGMAVETGKVTRGKVAGPTSGSGDAQVITCKLL